MSVLRGVGGVCEMYVFCSGGVESEGMRVLGLGFTNHVGTG